MLGHELTHIRNGDVRMMVIAVIIAGVVSFFAELVFRLWFYNGFSFRGSRSDEGRGGGASFAILIAIALTKNPDAMISALRKIEGRGELASDLRSDGNVYRQSPRRLRRVV